MLFFATILMGQKESAHWFFGDGVGLDFNSGEPVQQQSALNTLEGCAAISDQEGNLLFYTDGITVYNQNHQIMPNGTGLLGEASSSQSSIVVPDPANFNRYYIFTVDATKFNDADQIDGVNYSVVDMSLDNGLGDIVTSEKNIHLLDFSAEKLAAIKHPAEEAYWVLTYSNANNGALGNQEFNTIYAYKISSSGISPPVISRIVAPSFGVIDHRGNMKVSANGKKLAIASQLTGLFLVDFDPEKGIVEETPTVFRFIDEVENTRNEANVYGVEFSLSGRFLYADVYFIGLDVETIDELNPSNNVRRLYQLDLESDDIEGSKVLLSETNNFRGALQLALDGKIYRALSYDYGIGEPYLGAIHDPDALGLAANYEHHAIELQNGALSHQGLPPFIQSSFLAQIRAGSVCVGETSEFSIQTDDEILRVEWDFGDPFSTENTSTELTPSHLYQKAGEYTVTATIYIPNGDVRIFTKVVKVNPVPEVTLESKFKHYFLGQNVRLTARTQYEDESILSYSWTGTNGINPDRRYVEYQIVGKIQTEDITVTVTDTEGGCIGIAETEIQIYDDVEIALGEDRKSCNGESVTIGYPYVEGLTYIWTDGVRTNQREITESGIYRLFVITPDGNQSVGNIKVTIIPPVELEIETPFSDYFYGDTIDFSAITNIENSNFQWTGPNNFTSEEVQPELQVQGQQNRGTYKLTIKEAETDCDGIATKFINTHVDVETALGDDSHLCYGDFATYTYPFKSGFTYLWNDGYTNHERYITEAGTYTLTVTTPDGNTNTGSVTVTQTDLEIEKVETCYNQLFVKPKGGLPPYTYSLNGIDYQNTPLFTETTQGFHKIYVKDAKGCSVETEGDYFVNFKLYQAFSPNGDYINDTWDLSSLNGCRNIDIKIFDRYGKFLHQMKADQLIWNGKIKGKPLPSNTYWFIIQFNDEKTPDLKGHVTIKRAKD